jgi:hypothetical protein
MRNIFLVIMLLPFAGLSQKFSVDRPEEVAKPDPYTAVYFGDRNNYRNVTSVTTVVKDRSKNFKADTLFIDYYSKNLKVGTIRFDNSRRSTTTQYRYNSKNDIASWQTLEKNATTLTKYSYNQAGQLIQTHQYRITIKAGKPDTAETSRMLFKYDKLKLVQITNNVLGSDIVEQYHYNQDLLLSKTGGYVSKQFRRNLLGQVSIVEEYMGAVIDTTKLMGLETYTYDASGRVIQDSILTSSNMKAANFEAIQYHYGANGLLDEMRSTYKSFVQNVHFSYVDRRMKTVYVETNGNSAFLRFMINFRIPEYYSFPIKYREEFEYDAVGNKISRKVFVNDELFTDVQYLIQYNN